MSALKLRPAVLLTGFGPFPGVAENISGKVVDAVAARAHKTFLHHRFHAVTLPAEWTAAPAIVGQLIAELSPVLALHFGVAKDARGFRIETQGRNACRPSVDAAGRPPLESVLIAGAITAYAATLPADAIVRRLEALNFPVSLSDDAGGYLCNAVLYHALHTVSAKGHPCRAGFIHIPSVLKDPPLGFDAVVAGSIEIIRVSLEVPVKAG